MTAAAALLSLWGPCDTPIRGLGRLRSLGAHADACALGRPPGPLGSRTPPHDPTSRACPYFPSAAKQVTACASPVASERVKTQVL